MSDYVFVSSSGENIPIIIDTQRGLRNITLRPKTRPVREIHVSKPWLVPVSTALKFIESKRRWIERIFANAPQKAHVSSGDIIEFLGRRVQITHDPSRRANKFIICDDNTCVLLVGGDPEMLERRVRDFIKAEFLSAVKEMIKTVPREYWPARIAVRDTSTRWGSCSTSGTMSFSWRLAFAPREIMRYVVMHELAHTKHMDHSPAFWATVAKLYGDGVGRAKRWLKINGGELHRYF
ncbi:MAG: M48 family metallopeptidase [Alphaproteobacteria bacterium]|nr:M48 family metallopeptidase [Alphaproteobacteria bacterium]